MRVRIHRGARIVGGSCVEIDVGNERRIVGTGRLLDAGFHDEAGLACDTSGGAVRPVSRHRQGQSCLSGWSRSQLSNPDGPSKNSR